MYNKKYISDELLAAFIDGNTTQEQNNFIIEAFKENPEQYEEFRIAYLASNIFDDENEAIQNNGKLTNTGELPTIALGGIGLAGGIIGNIFTHSNIPMVAGNDKENFINNDRFEHSDYSIDVNNQKMETTIHKAPNVFGEEAKIDISYDVYQGYSDTCAIRSQQLVLNDFGIPITQEELIKEATEKGWYSKGEGTSIEHVGNLLEEHGVQVNKFENANIYNLTNELAQGHKVIIGVDANELWKNGILQDIKDAIIGETANHALIVAGIDTSDPKHLQIILEDPGTGDVAKAYPLDKFMDAWKDSHCYMVSTQEPAPLAFNQDTMMGFDYEKGQIENKESLLSGFSDTSTVSHFDSSHQYDDILNIGHNSGNFEDNQLDDYNQHHASNNNLSHPNDISFHSDDYHHDDTNV